MGYRLYVCKTYKVEYAMGLFNNCFECIDTILSEFCNNANFNEHGDIIEIDKEDYKDFLDNITKNKGEVIAIIKDFIGKQQEIYKEIIEDVDDYCNNKYNYILNVFNEIFRQADKDNDYIRLEWF